MIRSQAIEDEERFFRELIPVEGIDSEVGLNIIRAGHFLFDHYAENFRAHNMSEAQFNVLVVLDGVPEGMTMAEIARRMLVSRAGISGVIKGLESKGWVRRRPCSEDGRAFRVALTDRGETVFGEVLPDHLARVRDMIGNCFGQEEKETLIRLLTRLRGQLAERRAHT